MSTESIVESIMNKNGIDLGGMTGLSDSDLPDMSELESLEINEKEMDLSNQRYEKIIKNRVEEV